MGRAGRDRRVRLLAAVAGRRSATTRTRAAPPRARSIPRARLRQNQRDDSRGAAGADLPRTARRPREGRVLDDQSPGPRRLLPPAPFAARASLVADLRRSAARDHGDRRRHPRLARVARRLLRQPSRRRGVERRPGVASSLEAAGAQRAVGSRGGQRRRRSARASAGHDLRRPSPRSRAARELVGISGPGDRRATPAPRRRSSPRRVGTASAWCWLRRARTTSTIRRSRFAACARRGNGTGRRSPLNWPRASRAEVHSSTSSMLPGLPLPGRSIMESSRSRIVPCESPGRTDSRAVRCGSPAPSAGGMLRSP